MWTARQNFNLAREQRIQQRCADGYLQVLRLAEQEAQWLDGCVHNLCLDPQGLWYGAVERIEVPKSAVTDRATAAALMAAFGSMTVRACHAAWREAADALSERVTNICIGINLAGTQHEKVPDKEMEFLTDELQPKERATRQALAEAVAAELGHR